MADQKTGMGAEVGVTKLPDGTEPDAEDPPRWAYIFVYLMAAFALLGLWRAVEVLFMVI